MYSKILVPLDGSPMAECSLDQAKTVAKGCHVPEVILLGVVESAEQSIPFLWGGAQTPDTAEINSDRAALAKIDKAAFEVAGEYLKKTAEKLAKEGINVKTVVVEGKAAEAILEYARKNAVDIVIISSHGRGGKEHMDMGKIADRIIRNSMMPVIIASPPGCRK